MKQLFNPFIRIAGFEALWKGSLIVFVTAGISYYSGTLLDGIIDAHFGNQESFLLHIGIALINVLSLSLPLFLAGIILSKSKIRFVDVLGTQTLARAPFLLVTLSGFLFPHTVKEYFLSMLNPEQELPIVSSLDWTLFGLISLISFASIIWSVILMYNAYSISCNLKQVKGIASFIVVLILAEITSKMLIIKLHTFI